MAARLLGSERASDCSYTSCFCEENVWKMCERLRDRITESRAVDAPVAARLEDIYAVVVSSLGRCVPLFWQRASTERRHDYLVQWDYHVFLLHRPSARGLPLARRPADGCAPVPPQCSPSAFVYDLDSRLPYPCPAPEYCMRTFGLDKPRFAREISKTREAQLARVVPASVFLSRFASDRSHMVHSGKPFPTYPAIGGGEHNLFSHFVDMTATGFGTVMKIGEFAAFCGVGGGSSAPKVQSPSAATGVRRSFGRSLKRVSRDVQCNTAPGSPQVIAAAASCAARVASSPGVRAQTRALQEER
jgi:hypothetical protein